MKNSKRQQMSEAIKELRDKSMTARRASASRNQGSRRRRGGGAGRKGGL